MSRLTASGLLYGATTSAPWLVREASPPAPRPPRLLDRVREAIRSRHYSRRTEKAYVHWIRRFIFFHGKRHPAEMGAVQVTAFLTSLAVQGKVAASTQNQALSALLFLYREVLGVDLPWLEDVVRAKRPQYLPVVLTRDETRALLQQLNGVPRIMAVAAAAVLASKALQDIWARPSRRALQRHENSGRSKWRASGSAPLYRTVRKHRRVQER